MVGSTPLLGSFHELPLHQQGHPGAPGAPDVHGDGVLVTRAASVAMAEYARDRTIVRTVDLVTDAAGMAAELAYDLLNTALGIHTGSTERGARSSTSCPG